MNLGYENKTFNTITIRSLDNVEEDNTRKPYDIQHTQRKHGASI